MSTESSPKNGDDNNNANTIHVPPYEQQIAKLNIGGKRFQTTWATLLSKGNNFFTALYNGKIPSAKDEKGYFFIDRNGRYFEPLLEFLRTGEVIAPPEMNPKALIREADFYLIELPPPSDDDKDIIPGLYESTDGIYKFMLETDDEFPDLVWVTAFLEDDLLFRQEFNTTSSPRVVVNDLSNLNSKHKLEKHFERVIYLSSTEKKQQLALYFGGKKKTCVRISGAYKSTIALQYVCEISDTLPLALKAVYRAADGSYLFFKTKKMVEYAGALNDLISHTTQRDLITFDVIVLCERLFVLERQKPEGIVERWVTTLVDNDKSIIYLQQPNNAHLKIKFKFKATKSNSVIHAS